MQCVWNCQKTILKWFYSYGFFLGKHPFYFLIIPLVICGCLAVGFNYSEPVDDIEYLYAPSESRAIDDRETVRKTFPDMSDWNYSPFSLNELIPKAEIIFRSKKGKTILTDEVLDELESFYYAVLAIRVTVNGSNVTLDDVCKKRNGICVDFGGFVFESTFRDKVKAGSVTYPIWMEQLGVDMTNIFADVELRDEYSMIAAASYKITFPLKFGLPTKAWETEFVKLVEKTEFTTVNIAYCTSDSMGEELEKGTTGDILFFALTFTLMITFTAIVSSGGDCVSSRALLASAGVVAVFFGIMGAFGLVTFCGVNFVSIVGTMPFLLLGIGVDDMFLLMGSWSETLSMTGLTIPERMGNVYKKAGIGITITSVTDTLAFVIGASSTFRSVRNFCIYTGVGVIMCYICNACVFGACLTLHGRRVYSGRHLITCKKVEKSREELKKDGKQSCYTLFCGGKIPTHPDQDQSVCESGPRKVLVKFLLWNPVRYAILILFAAYLGVSIWGCTKLRQGLELKNLALKSSYFYTFQTWDNEDFGIKLPVSFVITEPKNYTDSKTLENMQSLLSKAQRDPQIVSEVNICWYTMYSYSSYFDTSSDEAFYSGLHTFLEQQPLFYNDIVFGPENRTITASRCHVYSLKLPDSIAQSSLMVKMRELADSSPSDVFAFHPAFVLFEQFVVIFSSTLQTVGVTIAVMFVATCIFLPHPLMVVLVIAQVLMIVVGIFGFMAHWDLTLSSVTMIEIIMSVGFSVDFCAHVCTAYMVSEAKTRMDRAKDSIIHASSPIFNGGISSLLGVFMLLFTESYIFQSFFKIMLLVIGFGVLHAVFLVPVVLSFIGPSAHVVLEEKVPPPTEDITEPKGHIDPSSGHANGKVMDCKDNIDLITVKVISNGKTGVSNEAFSDDYFVEIDLDDSDEVRATNNVRYGEEADKIDINDIDKIRTNNETVCNDEADKIIDNIGKIGTSMDALCDKEADKIDFNNIDKMGVTNAAFFSDDTVKSDNNKIGNNNKEVCGDKEIKKAINEIDKVNDKVSSTDEAFIDNKADKDNKDKNNVITEEGFGKLDNNNQNSSNDKTEKESKNGINCMHTENKFDNKSKDSYPDSLGSNNAIQYHINGVTTISVTTKPKENLT